MVNTTTAPLTPAQRKADLARNLALCTRDGLFAMPICTMALPVNIFLTALVTKGWVINKTEIGLLSAMPFFANFVQVFATPLIARWRSPKNASLAAATANMVLWAALVPILEFLPRQRPEVAAPWLIGWFFASSIFSAIAGVTWNAWVQEWVPVRLRGKYFGHRNRMLQIVVLTFMLVTGWALARWDYGVRVFQAIIVGAVILRVFSIYAQIKMRTREHRPLLLPPLTLGEQVEAILRAKSFLWFIAFGAVWSFAANCFGPFYHVFMFEQLELSAWDVGILSTVAALGGAIALPGWGRLLDRFGNRPVMVFSLLVWQLVNFLWCFLTPTNHTIVYIIWALGGMTSMGAIASSGFVLGQFTILLRLIPLEAKSLAIGLNLAVTSLAAAFAPIIGGYVLNRALAHWKDPIAVYHTCFILQPVLAIAGCLLLLRVHEPHASPVTMVFGAMRNIRTLSGVLGLEFLVNYVFYREQKPRSK
ncbi:MAG: MFS transporter [Verrucomicrobiota bacterium]